MDAMHSFVGVVKDTCSGGNGGGTRPHTNVSISIYFFAGLCPLLEFKGQLLEFILLSGCAQVQTPSIVVSIATMRDLIEIQGLLEPTEVQ